MRTPFQQTILNLRRKFSPRILESKWIRWLFTATTPVVVVTGVLPYVIIYWAFLPEWLGRLIVTCVFMMVLNGWFLLAPIFKWGSFRDLTNKATIPTKTIRGMVHFLRIPTFIIGIIYLWLATRPLVVGVISLARGEGLERRVVRLDHIRTVGLAHHVQVQDGESYLLLYGPTMPGGVPYEFVLLPGTGFVLEWKAIRAEKLPNEPNQTESNQIKPRK